MARGRRTVAALRAVVLLTTTAVLAAAGGGAVLWHQTRPTGHAQIEEVRIEPGMSARRIGGLLEERGLVRSGAAFALTVRLMGHAQELEAGTYQLDGTRTAGGIVALLLEAPVQTRRVTIPEGLTRHDIAGLLAHQAGLDSARFVALTQDPALARELGVDAPTLEGFLFPETYFLDLETTERAVIARMVEEFYHVFADSLRRRLPALALDLRQAVTLASIVEREAAAQDERPVIAGVFLRRLELDRRLESCATVEYALNVHKKRLTNEDLLVDSPYNTYRHRGLPPGPIGNPGRAALLATLYPADTEYLYFVARGDGTHIFSRTNREHTLAKQRVRNGR